MKKISSVALLALLSVASTVMFSDSGYHLIKKIPIPGDGQWDYISVDDVNRRVYVSHGTEIEVLDADSGAVVGKIPAPTVDPSNKSTSMGTHGAAIATKLGRGFTSNGQAGSMTIFDLKTLKILGEAKVGDGADGYLYDPATQRAFTFSNHTKDGTAVEGATGKVAGSVDVGGKPEAATADGKGHIFVNIEDKDMVLKIDSKKLTVMERWPTDPCKEPASMAIDPAAGRIFIGCHNKMLAVMDTENGHVVTTLPIGGGTDAAAFDPGTHFVFTSNGDGNITVIKEEGPDKYSVIDTVPTEPGARTMGLDLKTHKLFLSLSDRTPAPPAAPGERARGSLVPGTFRVLIVGRE